MARAVYTKDEYTVVKSKRGHVIINTKGIFEENHAHVKHLSTCKMVIGLIKKNIVPDSSYLRETVKRLSLDSKYIDKINSKIEKDKNRQYYFNPSKGVARK